MAYGQVSATLPDAFWRSVSWEEAVVPPDPGLRLRVLARVDGMAEFFDPPGNGASNLLWDLVGGGTAHRIDRAGTLNLAGQLDLRYFVEYRPGSFWPADSWKRTPRLYQIRVDYERATRTLYHEEE